MSSSVRWLICRCGLIGTLLAVAALGSTPAAMGAATPPVLEFVPAGKFPVALTSTSGPVTFEAQGGIGSLHCTSSSSKGQIVGPRESAVEAVYTGCSTEVDGFFFKCESTGAPEGEIKVGPLEAELVYVDKAEQRVGLVLNPKGGRYAAYGCGGVAAESRGSIVTTITPVNQLVTAFTQTFSQSHGSQTPSEYENVKGEKRKAISESATGSESAETGIEATNMTTAAEPVEIKVEPEKQEAASSKKAQEEEAAAAKKRQEEEAAAKRRQEEAASKAPPPATGSVSLDGAALTVRRDGAVSLRLTCVGSGTCAGKLTLTAKGKAKRGKKAKAEQIGTGVFSVAPGRTATVTVTLTAAGHALLKADHGSLTASLAILESAPTPSQQQGKRVHLLQRTSKAKGKK